MPSMDHIGTCATSVKVVDRMVTVTYHSTDVCIVDLDKDQVYLNSGGWYTTTTKVRMNQTMNVYGVPYQVYQKDYEWFVADQDGNSVPFQDHMVLEY